MKLIIVYHKIKNNSSTFLHKIKNNLNAKLHKIKDNVTIISIFLLNSIFRYFYVKIVQVKTSKNIVKSEWQKI